VDPLSIAPAVRRAVWEIDPDQPIDNLKTMEAVIAQIDTQNTFFLRIVTGLAVVALVLAGVGIYGVISYSVNQRSHEIGIRMALGAQPRSILFLVVKQGALLTIIGLPLGLGAAIAFVRMMGSQLQGFQAANASGPLTFVAVSLIFLGVAKLASYIPARRAVRVDPVVTLRHE
jgi:putative ABC transport system permease protein